MATKKTFAWSPIRDLMRSSGAEMVAHDAVDQLIEHLEDRARQITMKALEMTRHANRKKVIKADVEMAYELLK